MKSDANSLLGSLRIQIDNALAEFVASEVKDLMAIGNELQPVGASLSRFILDGGKRLRPIFACAGFLGSGEELTEREVKAAASLELIHVCALIHDDLMDGSDTRRGAPAIHREFEALHRSEAKFGNPQQYGLSAAILLGDLALVWSAKMFHGSGLSPEILIRTLSSYDELRIELMAGQFLDVYEQSSHTSSLERSRKIARYKSGKYTIERPLHFGAALANKPDLNSTYSSYGIPLGEAFQLRDDILGIFGESEFTGKPSGDDLLEGKRTALIAKAFELANASQAMALTSVLGNRNSTPQMLEKAREIIVDTGALEYIESLISQLTDTAMNSISGMPNSEMLTELAMLSTKRNS